MNASLGECEQIPILNPILNNPLLNPINGNGNPDALPVSQAVSQASEPATTQLLQQAVMEGRSFFAASGDNGSSCTVAYPGANGVANEGVPLTSDPANTPFTHRRRRHRALQRRRRARRPRARARLGVLGRQRRARSSAPPTTSRAWPTSTARAWSTATASRPTPASCAAACRTSPRCRATRCPTATRSSPTARTRAAAARASPRRCGRACGPTSSAPRRRAPRYGFANPAIYAIAKDPARYARRLHTTSPSGANGLNPALRRLRLRHRLRRAAAGRADQPGPGRDGHRRAPGSRRQRVRRPDRAGLEVRAQARGQGLAQAPIADRHRQRPRLPRPRRRARQERARGRRAARGRALPLPEGQAGLHQAAQLLEADLPDGEGHDALALRLPRAPGQGPLQRLRPGHRRRRATCRARCRRRPIRAFRVR